MNEYTSLDFNLDLNLPTRSCVVTGVFCIKTARISSSVTGPVYDVDAAFEDNGGAPFVGTLTFEAGTVSSFEGFTSCCT